MQTAVNWMIEELLKRHTGSLGSEYVKIFKQAKQMEKEQIIDAYQAGDGDAYNLEQTELFAKSYFDETYGSDRNFKQFSLYEHKETIASADTITSSQTEISDEEIEKAANIFWPKAEESSLIRCWILGAKWYREQLKTKK